jgi:hypothetical protein
VIANTSTTVNRFRSSTAQLQSQSSISVDITKLINITVSATSAQFAVVSLSSSFGLTANNIILRLGVSNMQSAVTLTVVIGSIRQFNAAFTVMASELSAINKTSGYFFINMDSSFALSCAVTKTTRYSADLSSVFTHSVTIIRQKPGTVNIAVIATQSVTAIKRISIIKTLDSQFSITAEPQPLNQILVVVRMNVAVSVTASGTILRLEEHIYIIPEENRIYTLTTERRSYTIRREDRTYVIEE